MMGLNYSYGLAFGWHLHIIFAAIAVLGAVFLVLWAAKSFSKDQLKSWTVWLVVIGVLGVLLTGHWGVRGWQAMHGNSAKWGGMMMHLDDEDLVGINTAEELREHMLEEIREHMGFTSESSSK